MISRRKLETLPPQAAKEYLVGRSQIAERDVGGPMLRKEMRFEREFVAAADCWQRDAIPAPTAAWCRVSATSATLNCWSRPASHWPKRSELPH